MTTKVQTNSVIDNTEAISHYSALELLKHDQFRSAILTILSNYVIYHRTGKGLDIMLNVNHLENMSNNRPYDCHTGCYAALILLGFTLESNKELWDRLDNIAFDIVDLSQSDIKDVAYVVLSNWEFEINRFYNKNIG